MTLTLNTTHLISLVLLCLLFGCTLPDKQLKPFTLTSNYAETPDSILISVQNPLDCPLRVKYVYQEKKVQEHLTLAAFEKGRIGFKKIDFTLQQAIQNGTLSALVGEGSLVKVDSNARYVFPFPKGKSYMVTQAYNDPRSHQNNYNRYSLDLNLAKGDTICAARKGVVVGIIQGYETGGDWERYEPYTNLITIYHADGTFAQYENLQYEGAMVKIGDRVFAGQPIALAGSTGFTASAQLHFKVLVPTDASPKSIPIKFIHINGNAIKNGFTLTH